MPPRWVLLLGFCLSDVPDKKPLTSYPAGPVFILCFVFLILSVHQKTNDSYLCVIKLTQQVVETPFGDELSWVT